MMAVVQMGHGMEPLQFVQVLQTLSYESVSI